MSEGAWEKLSHVAVKGAQYDSRERQPHPKCLKGTRVVLLNHIYESLDSQETSKVIWLHGTAGVGKSAVAFTVAERMRSLKVVEGSREKRLAATFFFSRKHTKRRTTGHFFATLIYQLATNFPSIKGDVNRIILDNPALLDHDTSLRDQMEELFLRPLRSLQYRLRGCPPLTFIIDALDECSSESLENDTSKSELVDLIFLLGEALREPDLPVTHILLTSRSEEYIRKAMQTEEMRPLVCEIPVKTSGEGIATIISLDGADVDEDICLFLQHSFRELGTCHPDFPQPSTAEIARLASRAGRRFIVASTMMKFIDDQKHDPRDRLLLMLELTNELLPGTEVHKLYDSILSTCADPARAYLHLSVIAALADPLPMAQISKLLGPGEGRDVENVLMQLRSVIDVPIDNSLPVNIHHSSVRDYVSHHSNSSLRQVHDITPAHSLLALSCLRLMAHDLPESTALPDALSKLTKHSQVIEPHEPQNLQHELNFTVQPLEPLQVLIGLLWLRGHRNSELQFWLNTQDGHAWLKTDGAGDWLETKGGSDWIETQDGGKWLVTDGGKAWRSAQLRRHPLRTRRKKRRLQTKEEKHQLQAPSIAPQLLVDPDEPEHYLHLHSNSNTSGPPQTSGDILYSPSPLTPPSPLLSTLPSRPSSTLPSRPSLTLLSRPPSPSLVSSTKAGWLETTGMGERLQTSGTQAWLQAAGGRRWLQWLETQVGRYWLLNRGGQDWLQTLEGRNWLQTQGGKDWLETPGGREWLQTQGGKDWLETPGVREWLETRGGKEWLETRGGKEWLETPGGRKWLQTQEGKDWLETPGGRGWLETRGGKGWLETPGGREWLQTQGGKDWLQTSSVRGWLETRRGKEWLETPGGREWLQTQGGKDWLQTPHGQTWRLTTLWVTMEEFSSTLETVRECIIVPYSPLRPAFQVIQQFKSLPDFLMFTTFLALRRQDHLAFTSTYNRPLPDVETIHTITTFIDFTTQAWERSRLTSDALKYACQNWVLHLSRAPDPWDEKLIRILESFWTRNLLSWLERQWCLKDLRSCLTILCEGEKLTQEHLQARSLSLSRI